MPAAKRKKVKKVATTRAASRPRKRATPGFVERATREFERRRGALSKEARAAYGEASSALKGLEKLVEGVERDFLRTEKKIEARARARIARLRREAGVQRRTLDRKRREAQRVLARLAAGADHSWSDVKKAADAMLREARGAASTIAKRFRTALQA